MRCKLPLLFVICGLGLGGCASDEAASELALTLKVESDKVAATLENEVEPALEKLVADYNTTHTGPA